MKERITFYTPDSKQICQVVMPYKDEWDWISVLENLTHAQLKAVKKSFLYYYKEWTGNSDWLIYEDLEDLYAFEDALADFSNYTGDINGFYTLEDITEVEGKKREGLTIRQLYEKAKIANALDIPITVSYHCSDSWYDFEDELITEDILTINEEFFDIEF